MQIFTFTDHRGIERVLRSDDLGQAQAAAHRFVLTQTEGSVAAAAVAVRTVKKATA